MLSIDYRNLSVAIVILFAGAATAFPQQKKVELPQPRFYKGPIGIQSVVGTIELQRGERPTARLDVTVRNNSQSRQQVSIGFRASDSVGVSLEPQAARVLTLTPKTKHSGNPRGAQNVRVDLAMEVNGMPVADPLGTVDVTVLLPQGTPAIIRSNMPLIRDTEDDRTAYRLTRQRVYLTELNLVYTLGPVTLSIEKNIQPNVIDKAGPVNITLTIRNLGREDALNVLLEDNFDPRDFSGEGEGFELYIGEENDRRLLWSRTVDRVRAGGSISVEYTVNALMPVHRTSLNAVTASIGGELVGVSNKIRLAGRQ